MNEINKVVFYVHTGMFAHGFDDLEHETSVFIRVVSRASLEHLEEEGAEHGVADEREDEHDVRKKRPHAFHRCPSGHRARAPLFHRHLLALSVSVLYMRDSVQTTDLWRVARSLEYTHTHPSA